jgi:membrane-associated phospholipid phosphatase
MSSTTVETTFHKPTLGLGPYGRAVWSAVLAGFRSHAILYGIALTSFAIGLIECALLGLPVNYDLISIVSGSSLIILLAVIAVWLVCDLGWQVIKGYRGSPTAAMGHKLQSDILAPSRIANALHIFLAHGIFFVGFIAIKKAIPHVQPFQWDTTFMEVDRFLHGGLLPHEWLLPLLGTPKALFIINLAYNFWFVVMSFCFFWFGYARQDSFLRQRYLIAYLSLWFVGTSVLGTVFSSAGPCFYHLVVAGADPYAGLMATLKAANESQAIFAVTTQDILWQSHLAGGGEVEGISAMPSLHVATSVLFFLQARAWGQRWAMWFTAPFALTILVGSVMLGWHYAVDGYAGALIALFCWWLAGKVAPRPVATT